MIAFIAVASVVMFAGAFIAVPMMAVRIPADYFAGPRRHRRRFTGRHPLLRAALLVLVNLTGYALILAGIAMIVLPGQGVLTILIGITLADFPGKFRLERWIIAQPPVLGVFNWLRRRAGQSPLIIDAEHQGEE